MLQGKHRENFAPLAIDGVLPVDHGNTRVSIVIPTFNRANLVGGARRSCIEQATEKLKLEVIVIDDGSSYGTQLERSRYDKLIQVVSFNKNAGRNL
jgi:glycosyltransferase involved in cell wall biosynthesis